MGDIKVITRPADTEYEHIRGEDGKLQSCSKKTLELELNELHAEGYGIVSAECGVSARGEDRCTVILKKNMDKF